MAEEVVRGELRGGRGCLSSSLSPHAPVVYARAMHPATEAAFVDELTKIAAKKVKDEGSPAREANNLFGLPFHPDFRRRGARDYQRPQAGALYADRSQSPIDGQSTANLSAGGAMYPATGPGGV